MHVVSVRSSMIDDQRTVMEDLTRHTVGSVQHKTCGTKSTALTWNIKRTTAGLTPLHMSIGCNAAHQLFPLFASSPVVISHHASK